MTPPPDPMTLFAELAMPTDFASAVAVWRAANEARGLVPDEARIARVAAKLAEADALVIVARQAGAVVGMTLAEPGRDADGAGDVLPGYGHVSMVFVRPDVWATGIGTCMLRRLHDEARRLGWRRLTLWTRDSNVRGRSLYEGQGYARSGRRKELPDGDPIVQYERRDDLA